MDTPTDFLFLNENLATNFNPFYEGEYLVIQTYPREKRLIIDKRSFNHKEARNYCDIQNLAHDYTSYSLRIFHNQKLWEVNFMGEPLEVSQQQDWKINEDYFQAERDENIDGEIVLCRCSYPYFSSLRTFSNNYGEGDEYWQPVTCLVEDNGRDIDNCPNCNCALIKLDENEDEEDDNYDNFIPSACRGCSNYDGEFYRGKAEGRRQKAEGNSGSCPLSVTEGNKGLRPPLNLRSVALVQVGLNPHLNETFCPLPSYFCLLQGDNQLICAIHPYGWSDESCPDFLVNDYHSK